MENYAGHHRLASSQQYTTDPALLGGVTPVPPTPQNYDPELNKSAPYYYHVPNPMVPMAPIDPSSIPPCDSMEQMMQANMQQFLHMSGGQTTALAEPAGVRDSRQKRKKDAPLDEESSDAKKMSSEEKKTANLRKNIRDVMDENQLDADTLVAQREESERLARVAEQQKLIREYQRQTAAHKRTQNRVMSLLKGCDAKTIICSEDSCTEEPIKRLQDAISDNNSIEQACTSSSNATDGEIIDMNGTIGDLTSPTTMNTTLTAFSDTTAVVKEPVIQDVVTIEDSSSEDDCIMLSDDEEEEDDDDELEEEPEDDPTNSGLHVKDSYNVPDELGRVVINVGHPEDEEDIYLAPQIARTIKPHQIGGVRFLFDNIIESTKRFKNSSGFGCILAHSMGLGKTLQVVCFCDIFLRHTMSKTVLCVMPINTLQNWVSEFDMWIPKYSADPDRVRTRNFDVFVLNDQHKTLAARARVVLQWAAQGGVLLIGYELFRLLALKLLTTRKRRNNKNAYMQNATSDANSHLMESIHEALVKPGPDLVICDEGHRIKNSNAGISLALKQIRTKRRIVLTGYPLQNNLIEYWCMVDFVRPNYLGTRTEFCNMFERPIQNGQCIDSTPEDIKLMRYRAHVLHSLLLGFVQRRSHMVLQQTLPQKLEYVVLTRMTPFQRQLYQTFMNGVVRMKAVPNPLKAFAICCKIWNHPDVLYNFLKKYETDLDDLDIDESDERDPLMPDSTASTSIDNKTSTLPGKDDDSSQNTTKKEEKNLRIEELIGDSKATAKMIPESSVAATNLSDQKATSNPVANVDAVPAENKPSEGYENMMNENYYQQCNLMPYSTECDATNYWQEPNVPYFVYKSLSSNSPMVQKQDVPAVQANEKPAEDGSVRHSSEIVDLDTNEIKTCETIIEPNLKNQSLKNGDPIAEDESGASKKDELTLNDSKDFGKDGYCRLGNTMVSSYRWASELLKKYEPGLIANSPKMEVLFCILNESIQIGDRVLVFSQSLLTLNLIEYFLQTNFLPGTNMYWHRNATYFRLDGSTTSQEREKLVNEFNSNTNVKLFLISTRAGSLGINLVGANRVIVFDASWNPCHDTQAVYRIYRYGQKKSCYVYRIVMDKCLEKKIYDRQIKKQGMSDRVVDECNPDAHLSMKDVTNLCHDFDYENENDEKNESAPEFAQPLDAFPDFVMQKIIADHKICLSKEPFLHESLLVDRKEKKLSQAEKRQAHRGYEMEKKATIKQTSISTFNKFQYRTVAKDGTIIKRPIASIRPMQTTKTTSGVRSTRWIPAEVWQRQGMTAQEMTLPLDVVIPTNTSDKSNIVLKAGQRVMVLKSAKGIYMQLDSGKIIAIRTSSKVANEEQKNSKEEVIDITSEDDASNKEKTTEQNSPNSDGKDGQISNIEKCITNVAQQKEQNDSSGSTTGEYSSSTCKGVVSDELSAQNMKNLIPMNVNSQQQLPTTKITPDPKFVTASSYMATSNSNSNISNNNAVKSTTSPSMTSTQTPLRKPEQYGLPPVNANMNYTYQGKPPTHLISGDTNSIAKDSAVGQSPTSHSNSAMPTASASTVTSYAATKRDLNATAYNADLKTTTAAQPYAHMPNALYNNTYELAATSNTGAGKMSNVVDSRVGTNLNKTKNYSSTAVSASNSSIYNAPPQKGNKVPLAPIWKNPDVESGSNGPTLDRTSFPGQSQQSNYAAGSSKMPQIVHQQSQPQHTALPIYMAPPPPTTHYRIDEPSMATHVSMAQRPSDSDKQLLPSNAFFPDRDIHSFQHYNNNMYNNTNFPASCDYSQQLTDYSAPYGSYGHAQYHHSNLHSNSYRNIVSAAPISSNPYSLHWPPLVAAASAATNEQYHNSIYQSAAAAYPPQNGVQPNPWCNP